MKSRKHVQKAAGHVSAVITGVLFIGISIQILLGIIWMCCHFSRVPRFGESLFYLQVSRTLLCEESRGILYPVFLRLVGRNHDTVYALQLAAACAAAWYFLRVFRRRGKWGTAWGCLAFLTIPVVMQCHMAVLPFSFAASLLLTELSLLAEGIRNARKRTLKRLAGISFCWLVLSLLLPEYLCLGGVPVLLFFLCCYPGRKGNGRTRYYGFLLTAAFAGMIVGIQSLARTQGTCDRVEKTPLMTLTQRIAWTNLLEDSEEWLPRLADCVDRYTILEAAENAEGMDNLFFPAVEGAVEDRVITRREADIYYLTVTKLAWQWHKTEIVKEIIWDMLGYGASPAALPLFLAGRGYDTCSSRNYDFFLEGTPKLSRFYMAYGCWWFVAAVVLTALLQALGLYGGGMQGKKETALAVFCFLTTAGIMVLWYTMQGAGLLDYKKTVVIPQLWTAWTVLQSGRGSLSEPCREEGTERDLRGG